MNLIVLDNLGMKKTAEGRLREIKLIIVEFSLCMYFVESSGLQTVILTEVDAF